jgi:hypothetical protein
MKRASLILAKGDARCRGVSPFYLIWKKNTYCLFFTGFSLHQHAACPLAHIRFMCLGFKIQMLCFCVVNVLIKGEIEKPSGQYLGLICDE